MSGDNALVAGLFREQAGRLTALLLGRFGASRLDDIEDAVQDALLGAMRSWSLQGTPDNPAAWLYRAARNALIDRLRRRRFDVLGDADDPVAAPVDPREPLGDDLLGLLFTCCLPDIEPGARLALTLKLACGLNTAEIAGVLMESESTVAQRIVRAKASIRSRGTTPEFPATRTELQDRLHAVAATVYTLFTVGYFSSTGPRWSQPALCIDALRMACTLAEHRDSCNPETQALAALLCFSAARIPARGDPASPPIPLSQQNRQLWDPALIAEAFRRFERSIHGNTLSRYHIECAIAACHARAQSLEDTDWKEVLMHYDRLCADYPSPAASLNRLIALSRARGAETAWQSLTGSEPLQRLEGTTIFQAALGQLREDLGDLTSAAEYYEAAAAAAGSEVLASGLRERAVLLRGAARTTN